MPFMQCDSEPFLVDGFHAGSRHLEGDPATFLLDQKTLRLQIGAEFAFGLVVGVGNVVAHNGHLAVISQTFMVVDVFVKASLGPANIQPFRQNAKAPGFFSYRGPIFPWRTSREQEMAKALARSMTWLRSAPH